MKNYELVIETKQPTCGGQSPKRVDFREVQTDDPVEYVRKQENGLPMNVTTAPDGSLVIEIDVDEHHVKYNFTEA